MNYLKKTIPFMAVLLMYTSTAVAQNIDSNRMNRDINIMENILQEMFKTQFLADNNQVRIHGGQTLTFGQSHDIRGTYLPDYGVIFNIPAPQPGFVLFQEKDGKEYSYNFEYGEGNEGEKVTEESITNRIVEFLQDYGSTIGQLSNKDRLMVIYNSEARDQRVAIFHLSGDEDRKQKTIPTISVVATKANLQAYRSGAISGDEFRKRLDISTSASNSNKEMDLKVIARVLKTAFEDTEEKSFRAVGSVNYLKLDNFGALFSFDARYLEHEWGDLRSSLKVIQGRLAEARIELREELEIEEKKELNEKRKKMDQHQAEQKKDVLNAYKNFLSNLKGYIVDYGRTLNSLESEQHILVSITLSSRFENVPGRIDLQIQKATLEAIGQGEMSREQAMDQIQFREY